MKIATCSVWLAAPAFWCKNTRAFFCLTCPSPSPGPVCSNLDQANGSRGGVSYYRRILLCERHPSPSIFSQRCDAVALFCRFTNVLPHRLASPRSTQKVSVSPCMCLGFLQIEHDEDARPPRAAAAHQEGRVRVDGLDPAWEAKDVRVCVLYDVCDVPMIPPFPFFPLSCAEDFFDHNFIFLPQHYLANSGPIITDKKCFVCLHMRK